MSATAAYDMATEQWPDTLVPHRVTVEEFGRMGEAGVFDPEARLELIDGEILEMSPIRPPHAYSVDALAALLMPRLIDRAAVKVQNPAELDRISLPQPDVVVATAPLERYATRHPRPDETFLVIEVADTTVRSDRKVKMPKYASSGIAEAWLVDIQKRKIEVYTDPKDGRYASVEIRRPGQTVAPSAFPELELPVTKILPPQPVLQDDE